MISQLCFWYKSDGNDPEEVAVVSNKDWNSGGNPGFAIGDMRNGMTLNFRANDSDGRLDTGRYGGATEKTTDGIILQQCLTELEI